VAVGGVSLVSVGLDDDSFIHLRAVVLVMLGGIVWVNGVGHV